MPPPLRDLHQVAPGVFAGLVPRHRPVLTRTLIVAIVVTFVVQLVYPPLTGALAVDSEAILAGEWWRLATGTLVHGGLLHIFMNASFGWDLGSRVERTIGAFRMLVVSVSALVGAGLFVVAAGQTSIGFSGVLYGWLSSWFAFHLTSRFPGLRLSGPQRQAYLRLLGLNLLISLMPGISLLGHLGGFVAGFAAAFVLGMGQPNGTASRRP